MECRKEYRISDYLEEIDPEMWDQISMRPVNRA
jgi:hypothetical protein